MNGIETAATDALRAGLRRVLRLEDYESQSDEDLLVAAESAYAKAELRATEVGQLRGALRPPVDTEYLPDVEPMRVVLNAADAMTGVRERVIKRLRSERDELRGELERLQKVEQGVSELASEWDRFGLTGAAQRLRHILGEVTS